MYEALYSKDIGLCGFRCRVESCTRVVRTRRGILMHCRRVHGLVAQMQLFEAEVQAENQDGVMMPIAKENMDGKSKAKAAKKPELVRDERASVFDAADGEQLFRDSGGSTYRDPSS